MKISSNEIHDLMGEHEDYVALEGRDNKLIIYMSSVYSTDELINLFEKMGLGSKISVIACKGRK